MSAIDLFAAALGAFIVLSMVLFPSYLKTKRLETDAEEISESMEELRERLEVAREGIADARSRHDSAFAAKEKKRQLDLKRKQLLALRENGTKWEAKLVSAIENPSSFAILGHRTQAQSFLILVDVSAGLTYPKDYSQTMLRTVDRIIESLGHKRPFEVIGFRTVDGADGPTLELNAWPEDREPVLATDSNRNQAVSMLRGLASERRGINATGEAVVGALETAADAILLITYNLPLWPEGVSADAVERQISAANTAPRKEIHSIAMGTAFDREDFYKFTAEDPRAAFIRFMQRVAQSNRGDFSAIVN